MVNIICFSISGPKAVMFALRELRWPTPVLHTQYYCLLLLYSILHNFLLFLNFTSHFQFNNQSARSHPLTLTNSFLTINSYRYSFYINVPFLWNRMPHDILSSSSPTVFKSKLCQYFVFMCRVPQLLKYLLPFSVRYFQIIIQ